MIKKKSDNFRETNVLKTVRKGKGQMYLFMKNKNDGLLSGRKKIKS